MNKIYIPIGCGCASATLLKQKGLRSQSFPFDWILSHMDFVNDIIESFYDNSIENTLELFLDQSNNSVFSSYVKHDNDGIKYVDDFGNIHDQRFEAYKTFEKGKETFESYVAHPYNRKYKITFPHDMPAIDKNKYKRRIERLKTVLLDMNNFISFVYVSASSNDTHYSVNSQDLTAHAGLKLNKLCDFLETKRENFEVVFVDSLEDGENLNHRIKRIQVEPYKNWFPMITKNKIDF